MKIIVAGGRNFNNYELLRDSLDRIFQRLKKENIVIISGTAKGADSLGEQYSKERGYKLEKFPANWNRFQMAAGPIRNEQMAQVADALVLFWNGKSRGSADMLERAKKHSLKVRVVKY